VSLQEYRQFIASRAPAAKMAGFEPRAINSNAKAHQDVVLRFALNRGKSAAFLDCVSGDTLITTSQGDMRIDDLANAGHAITVLSRCRDGSVKWSLATAPFAKGYGDMFKVTMSDGRTIRATAGHRFLTPQGWVACEDVCVGQLLECAPDLHPTIEGTCLSTSLPDDQHWMQTPANSTDDCSSYFRRYGQQLRKAEGICQAFAPSLAYALALDGCYLQTDAQAQSATDTPCRHSSDRPSMPGSIPPDLNAADALQSPLHSSGSGWSGPSIRILQRLISSARLGRSWRELLQYQFQQTLGVPSWFLSGKVCSVASIHKLGQEIKYDMHVPGDECYLGNGIWCHNTGLGKSFIELEFARQCAEETGKPSLILTPLAVAGQMIREGHKFGIDARQIREQSEVGAGVMVANYERLAKLDPASFGAVVLDESSILKSYAGRTRAMIQDAFELTPFKMAATATPSPNDHTELGNHAEFLGVMRQQEMLSKWFINDTATASQDWRLKGHAVEDFWGFVASWSRCATLPSDLGGDDAGYILPDIDRKIHTVAADRMQNVDEGMLFRIPEMSATSFHAEKRLTLQHRCDMAAELSTHDKPVTVWCETNDESALLSKMIPGAMEVRGDMDADEKEKRLLGFADGAYRVIVTKPKLAGFGVNWQHCAHAVFASISFSYEQHYQAVRRSHRFGQTEVVRNDIVIADTEASIWNVVNIKSKKHDEMKRRMAEAMKSAQSDTKRREAYDRPLDLEFPSWVKTGS